MLQLSRVRSFLQGGLRSTEKLSSFYGTSVFAVLEAATFLRAQFSAIYFFSPVIWGWVAKTKGHFKGLYKNLML